MQLTSGYRLYIYMQQTHLRTHIQMKHRNTMCVATHSKQCVRFCVFMQFVTIFPVSISNHLPVSAHKINNSCCIYSTSRSIRRVIVTFYCMTASQKIYTIISDIAISQTDAVLLLFCCWYIGTYCSCI